MSELPVLGGTPPCGPRLSPLMARDGAVADADPSGLDAAVAWHYGDPLREQRALLAGTAVTDLSHRGLLVVQGPDRRAWLHSLTTQHLSDLAPGTSVETLILSPFGHVEHSLHVVDDGERTWLSVEPGAAEPVAHFLQEMRFRKRVSVLRVDQDWAAVGVVLAPQEPAPAWALVTADDLATAESGRVLDVVPPPWQDPWPQVGPESGAYTPAALTQHPGWQRPWRELWVPRAQLAQRLAAVTLAGSWAAEALRIAAWRPRAGRENDHRLLPHEADWLRTGVHLEKGCYRGQETVARVYHLGRPPRRLVLAHLDGSEHSLPVVESPVRASGQDRPVGRISSAALHYELGPIALAVIKRGVDVEATLDVAGVPASQEVIVSPSGPGGDLRDPNEDAE